MKVRAGPGGRGQSAIPYLHVQEVPRFFTCLLDRLSDLPPGQVVIARGHPRTVSNFAADPPELFVMVPDESWT
jgi:hypothetical protein